MLCHSLVLSAKNLDFKLFNSDFIVSSTNDSNIVVSELELTPQELNEDEGENLANADNFSQDSESLTNISAPSLLNASVTVAYSTSTTIFFDDFDASPETGWTTGATSGTLSWATGNPQGGRGSSDSGSADPTSDYTASNTDNNVYGQGLGSGNGDGVGGHYDNTNEWLKSPAIDCGLYTNVQLSFYRFANFENNYDEAYVEVSNDNVNWTDLGHPTYPLDNSWTFVSFDISSVADGESTVYVRWRSDSDYSISYSGWNIDDVTITGDPPPAAGVVWTGSVNNEWNNTGNWSTSLVPTETDDIEIPDVSGASGNFPILGTGVSGVCKNITIASGANLTINSGYELEVYGHWINNGNDFIGSSGTVSFRGSSIQYISGTTTFANVIINSSSSVNLLSSLDINGNITLTGGNLNNGAYTINLAGNWTSTGDYFSQGSGAVIIDGLSNSTISGSSSTISQSTTIFFDDFDASPETGWTTGATSGTLSWATGNPQGGRGDSNSGSADPTSDYTASNTDNNVYGQGLGSGNGDGVGGHYDNTNEWLKSPAIDCSLYTNVQLSFYRYANFENSYDEAYLEVSNDNINWTDLGHPTYPSDNSWTFVSFDISSVADGESTVYVRWRSDSDGSISYSGWNIDDVTVSGNVSGGYIGEVFEDLTINKTSGEVDLLSNVFVNDVLTLNSGIVNTTSSSLFEIGWNGSATGTSNASHINGPVIKRSNSTTKFTFPIGDGSSYRAAAITPSSSDLTSWTCEYFNSGFGDYTVTGSNINHVSINEYWDIDRSGSSNATIELSWNVNSSVDQVNELGIAHYNGSDWENAGANNQTGSITSGTVESNSSWSTFSPFTLKSSTSNNPLPVDMIKFTAECHDEGVMISWLTASELNNDYFEIQYSYDGFSYNVLDYVDGNGTTTDHNEYFYFDKDNTEKYYRLKQYDYNGENEVLSPVYASCETHNPSLEVTDKSEELLIILEGFELNFASMNVFDPNGKIVYQSNNIESGNISLTKNLFSTGIYFIVVADNKNQITHKQLIKN